MGIVNVNQWHLRVLSTGVFWNIYNKGTSKNIYSILRVNEITEEKDVFSSLTRDDQIKHFQNVLMGAKMVDFLRSLVIRVISAIPSSM